MFYDREERFSRLASQLLFGRFRNWSNDRVVNKQVQDRRASEPFRHGYASQNLGVCDDDVCGL